jgi:hypothetical protein
MKRLKIYRYNSIIVVTQLLIHELFLKVYTNAPFGSLELNCILIIVIYAYIN